MVRLSQGGEVMGRRGRPSTKQQREANVEREANHVIESWDWLLDEKIESLDRLVKFIFNELALIGMSKEKAIEKLQPIFLSKVSFISNTQQIKKEH